MNHASSLATVPCFLALLALGGLAGCVADVGVEGEGGAVYYGSGYDSNPWFHDRGWVRGRNWDRHNDGQDFHAPPSRSDGNHDGRSGPHLPDRPRPHGNPSGGGSPHPSAPHPGAGDGDKHH